MALCHEESPPEEAEAVEALAVGEGGEDRRGVQVLYRQEEIHGRNEKAIGVEISKVRTVTWNGREIGKRIIGSQDGKAAKEMTLYLIKNRQETS